MSLYAILGSNNSLNYFPHNKPYRFRSQLNVPLNMNGMWKVALMEAEISTSLSKTDALYVYSNICGDSIVNGRSEPLLRRLMTAEPGNWSTILETPHYLPVKISEIYDIDIYITDETGELASFLNQPSTVTLHFKAFPFV